MKALHTLVHFLAAACAITLLALATGCAQPSKAAQVDCHVLTC